MIYKKDDKVSHAGFTKKGLYLPSSSVAARAWRFELGFPARRRDNSSLKYAELPRHHKARGSSIIWSENTSYIESAVSAITFFLWITWLECIKLCLNNTVYHGV